MAMTLEFPRNLNPTWFAYTAEETQERDHKVVSWELISRCDSNILRLTRRILRQTISYCFLEETFETLLDLNNFSFFLQKVESV